MGSGRRFGARRGDREVDGLAGADEVGVRDLRVGGEEFGQGDSARAGEVGERLVLRRHRVDFKAVLRRERVVGRKDDRGNGRWCAGRCGPTGGGRRCGALGAAGRRGGVSDSQNPVSFRQTEDF